MAATHRAHAPPRHSMNVEVLENRRLMSVVQISPPSSGDAAVTIRNALRNYVRAGDTLDFLPGTYNIQSKLILPGGVTYSSTGGATLTTAANSGLYCAELDTGNANNVTINGLTFSGGGIRADDALGAVDHLTIENCTFTAPGGISNRRDNNSMIYLAAGTSNSLITGNTFTNIASSGYGISAYNITTTRIVNNSFSNVGGDGISYYAYMNDRGRNVQLDNNVFTNMPDKAIETGGPGANGVEVAYNQILDPQLNNYYSDDTMGLSIVFWSNQPQYPTGTVTIHDNTIVGPKSDIENGRTRPGVRIAIEAAGDHTQVYNNHVCGTNVGVAIGYSMLSSAVHDNQFLATNYPSGIVYEGYSPPWHIYSNDTSSPANCAINLTPTPLPGTGPFFPPVTTTPTPTPTPTAPPVLSAVSAGTSSIALSWSDTSTASVSYLIERRLPTDNGFVQILDTTQRTDGKKINALTFVDTTVPSGTYAYYRVRSVSSSGTISAYSNLALAKTKSATLAAYEPRAVTPLSTSSSTTDTLAGLLDLTGSTSPFASS